MLGFSGKDMVWFSALDLTACFRGMVGGKKIARRRLPFWVNIPLANFPLANFQKFPLANFQKFPLANFKKFPLSNKKK